MDKSSGELVTLTPNNNNTVQPVALMRLGVFVPTLKSLKNSKKNTLSRTDATEELTRLSLARAEGFDKVEITGPRLDMDNDFKTWVGIIHSLKRIAGTVISFSRTDEKHTREYITHLVQSAYYDTERDIVQLQADPRLFELYQFDRKVLLQLKAINALKRRESAQALYTFIESLPRDPAPISLARLRARLNLKSPVFSQNQTVRRAMEQLREIGYLDYTEIQRGRTKFFCIHYRRPRLKAPNDESKENQLPPSPAEKISPEMAEKLALLEKLGITLDDLEKLFKSR